MIQTKITSVVGEGGERELIYGMRISRKGIAAALTQRGASGNIDPSSRRRLQGIGVRVRKFQPVPSGGNSIILITA